MRFTVTIQPSGRQFDADDEQTVLESALQQSVLLPYGCKTGACGSCKCRVVSGEVEQGPHAASALRPEEAASGYVLLCCAYPRSDLAIEARVVMAGDIQIRKMPCRIASLQRVAPDVIIVKLQLPANETLRYLAGQYLEFVLRDGTRRSYSMAGAPQQAQQIELHIRHLPGGRFTDALFGVAAPPVKERDVLRFEGPMGTFFLREDSDKPIILLASGTGFAPIKAIVEHAIDKSITRPMTLYWGGRRPQDLYLDALAEQWAAELPHFDYRPVISDARPEDAWTGRTGFVHQAVVDEHPDLSGHQVYACGAPIVVDSARRDFVARCGLPDDEFYADSFTSAADTVKLA
ncbi:MAG: CDP-6-deoxy-delta-3,4-glucoseen reductase [Burkholderiaceae bacterium]